LKAWDYRSDVNSVATTLAVHWAERLAPVLRNVYIDQGERDQVQQARQLAATASAETLLKPLAETVSELGRRFGTWKIPWGDINRMQRINNSLELVYDDNQPSVGVGFASATWGMLPSYNSRTYTGTQKRYGYHGNSFVCAVEFGDKVKAKSVLAGGNSGNPSSPHFADQLAMYATGRFKDVLFYKDDVQKHSERSYQPGQ
jgi:acyl-homoserine lactone acylase PvdQ